MSFFPAPPTYTAFDVTQEALRVAQMRKTRKGWEIIRLETVATGADVNPLDSGTLTAAALPSEKTLVRTCEMQVKRERNLKAILDFQIEPLLPYPAERAIIQAEPIEKRINGILLTAYAVRTDHLKEFIEKLSTLELEPERITSVPSALAALSTLFPQTATAQFLVYEGEETTTCVLVEKGHLLASRAFDSSLDIGKEVQKTILSFAAIHKTKTFETILLIGSNNETIQKATGKTVLLPTTSLLALSQEDLIHYGLSIGIALAAEGVDFRQKEFVYPHKWRRIKKPLLAMLALSTLLFATIAGFGHVALQKKKAAVEQAYLSLLEVEEVEAPASLPDEPFAYHAALSELEKKVHTRPDTFPLHPALPKVREFLAWLSAQAAVEVDGLHYAMVKRPDFAHKKERYKVKIDLEFSAKQPSAATAFHDLLSQPNAFVDPNEEVQWTAGKGKYRATFYLKDKTRYL